MQDFERGEVRQYAPLGAKSRERISQGRPPSIPHHYEPSLPGAASIYPSYKSSRSCVIIACRWTCTTGARRVYKNAWLDQVYLA